MQNPVKDELVDYDSKFTAINRVRNILVFLSFKGAQVCNLLSVKLIKGLLSLDIKDMTLEVTDVQERITNSRYI